MKSVLVLGPGCSKCQILHSHAVQAVEELGIECEVIKISDLRQIMALGVMSTPGLVVNGTVRSVGRVISVADIKEMLK